MAENDPEFLIACEKSVAHDPRSNPRWKIGPTRTLYENIIDNTFRSERLAQACIVRDIFGNPFCPVIVDPTWLARQEAAVARIAQTIYDERRFADMPILADALEEAGCTDADILNHCRQPGEHVRGCWVVDLLLGKS